MREANTGLRSTDPADYQRLPQSIGAMVKRFTDGHVIAPHAHERDQLLYAVTGIMRLKTSRDALIVPPERAVYIPSGVRHTVGMHGEVEMRTLYITPSSTSNPAAALRVLSVSPLLRELIIALCDEPMSYSAGSRGDHIARLIESEIDLAGELPLSVPLPNDPRLQRVCAAILASPSDGRTLDGWSDVAGASARTLVRLFESELGLGFREWRQRVRIQHALEAVAKGTSISRVARACGYRSPSAFTLAFRRAMGCAPSSILNTRAPSETVAPSSGSSESDDPHRNLA